MFVCEWKGSAFVVEEGVDLLCLQEAKAFVLADTRCFELWGDSNIGWLHYEGENGARSTLTMWYKEALCYESHLEGRGYIPTFGLNVL